MGGKASRSVRLNNLEVPWRMARHILVEDTSKCWLWTGQTVRGYGRIGWKGRTSYNAHRAMYEMFIGEIPKGMQVDHLCRRPECVNPLHLEAVTPKENVRRSTVGKLQLSRTHCPKGHPYLGANLYVTTKGHRACRACILAAGDVYRAANKDALNAKRRARYAARRP